MVWLRKVAWRSARLIEALQFAFLSGFTPQLLALIINATVGLAFNGIWSVVVQVGGWCTLGWEFCVA